MTEIDDSDNELRMYLVVRGDITLPLGKAMGQAGHAFSMLSIQTDRKDRDFMDEYIQNAMPKIVIECRNEYALYRAQTDCINAGLNQFLVIDAGRTVFPEPTATCLAIGPCYRRDLPKFVHRMQLLD